MFDGFRFIMEAVKDIREVFAMAKHLIVISNDAMVYEDVEILKTLPNFSRYWPQMCRVDRVRSIYPSITYPCHCTMMTGVYPDRHGVVNNEQIIMGELSSPWIHFRDAVCARTIFDYAKAAGLTTAAVFWPVTGNDPSIDYLVDEFWPQLPGETTRECFARSGSSPEVLEKVVDPNLHFVVNRDRQHPYADSFVMACASAMVREFKPNLLMVHPAHVDGYRHATGLFTERVKQGLYEMDLWFGDLVKATQDAGIFEDTDFILTSDHGQMNIVRTISPNVILAEHGLIDVDADGNFVDYRAFCKSTALSSHVYLKNPDDRTLRDEVYALLTDLCRQEVYGISRVFTAEEAQREEHLAGGFSFVLESDGFSAFTNEWCRPYVRNLDVSDYRFGRATHGHLPEKGPQPTLFGFGPSLKPGAALEHARLVDQAPTFAHILGLEMENVDGRALDELLK